MHRKLSPTLFKINDDIFETVQTLAKLASELDTLQVSKYQEKGKEILTALQFVHHHGVSPEVRRELKHKVKDQMVEQQTYSHVNIMEIKNGLEKIAVEMVKRIIRKSNKAKKVTETIDYWMSQEAYKSTIEKLCEDHDVSSDCEEDNHKRQRVK